jgi:hypothetical protein
VQAGRKGAGAALIVLGVFGSLIVITLLALKLVLAAVVLYALVRIAWAYARAWRRERLVAVSPESLRQAAVYS